MPNFPTYRGELPTSLNPFNLRHYLLLVYWVYFRPTAIKYYLYKTNPNLYSAASASIWRSFTLPAYRNLYLMIPGAILLLSTLLGGIVMLIDTGLPTTPIDWSSLGLTVARALVIAVIYASIGSLVFGVAEGVAGGIAVGVALGVALGLLEVVELKEPVLVLVALIGGLAVRVVFSVAASLAVGLAYGIACSVAAGIVAGMAFDVRLGVLVGIAVGVGALGIIFYPLQLVSALLSNFRGRSHPVQWDELLLFPLPRTERVLIGYLQHEPIKGLGVLGEVARNPFQRWAAQRALYVYLHKNHPAPLQLIYDLLDGSQLNEYAIAPTSKLDWEVLPSLKQLLLGELNQKWVDCHTEWANSFAERLVWLLTEPMRLSRETPLTRFCGMLYSLLVKETVDGESFNLGDRHQTYTDLTDYPGGAEISNSFAALAAFLAYDNLSDLPAALDIASGLGGNFATAIRPGVMNALVRLGEVAAEVATYETATSRVNQQAALLRATDALNELDKHIAAEVVPPEETILQRIIRQWRGLVSQEGGSLGRVENSVRIISPYVAGNPVDNNLFVGREDILRELEETWDRPGQSASVVLYGHRRMGKSSILRNLSTRFDEKTAIVDFNMQRVGPVENTGELLWKQVREIHRAFCQRIDSSLLEPDREEFLQDPYLAFDDYLWQLDQMRDGNRLIFTIDEFEGIEALIEQGRIDAKLLEKWRATFQTYPWFIIAFAGLHNLEEMRRDYWNPIYAGVKAIKVSFLKLNAAQKLITEPTPDFAIDYSSDAVEEILKLTNGQPYLVQLICDNLVSRFNRQTFYENIERDRRFTLEDVHAIIDSDEFYQDGSAYFNGVWGQAEETDPTGQLEILKALTSSPLSFTELMNETHFDSNRIQEAVETLERHDVLEESDGKYGYTVELMRRWVVNTKTNK